MFGNMVTTCVNPGVVLQPATPLVQPVNFPLEVFAKKREKYQKTAQNLEKLLKNLL